MSTKRASSALLSDSGIDSDGSSDVKSDISLVILSPASIGSSNCLLIPKSCKDTVSSENSVIIFGEPIKVAKRMSDAEETLGTQGDSWSETGRG